MPNRSGQALAQYKASVLDTNVYIQFIFILLIVYIQYVVLNLSFAIFKLVILGPVPKLGPSVISKLSPFSPSLSLS